MSCAGPLPARRGQACLPKRCSDTWSGGHIDRNLRDAARRYRPWIVDRKEHVQRATNGSGSKVPTTKACSDALFAASRSHLWSKVISLFIDVLPALGASRSSSWLCSAAVTACGRGNAWLLALRLADMSRSIRSEVDALVCSAAVSACEKVSSWCQALSLLSCVSFFSLLLDAAAWNAAVSACSRGHRWTDAAKIATAMRRSNVEGTLVTSNAAVCALGRGGQWEHALSSFGSLHARGMEPNTISHNVAISASEGSVRWQWSLQLYSAVCGVGGSNGLQPSAQTFSALAAQCGDGHQWECVNGLLGKFGILKLQPNLVILNAVASAFAIGRRWARALRLVHSQTTVGEGCVSPDTFTFVASILSCGDGDHTAQTPVSLREHNSRDRGGWTFCDWSLMVYLLRAMRLVAVRPNVLVFNSALGVCADASQAHVAIGLTNTMHRCRLSLDLITFGAAVSAVSEGNHAAHTAVADQGMTGQGLASTAVSAVQLQYAAGQALQRLTEEWSDGGCSDNDDQASAPGAVRGLPEDLASVVLLTEELTWIGGVCAVAAASLRSRLLDPVLPALRALAVVDRAGRVGSDAGVCPLRDVRLLRQYGLGPLLTSEALFALDLLPNWHATAQSTSANIRNSRCGNQPVAQWAETKRLRTRSALSFDSDLGQLMQRTPTAQALAVCSAHQAWVRRQGLLETASRVRVGGSGSLLAEDIVQGASSTAEPVGVLLRPLLLAHDRAPHAERQALLAVLQSLRLVAHAEQKNRNLDFSASQLAISSSRRFTGGGT